MFWYIASSLVLCTIIYLIIWYKESSKKLEFMKKHFPTPPLVPLFGMFHLFAGKSQTEIFQLLVSFHFKYGLNVLTVGLFNAFTLNVTKPKDVETVLLSKSTQTKALYYDFFRPWLGNSLLNASGMEWFAQRKTITPAFHFNILNEFIIVFNRRIEQMMGILKKFDGNDAECDIHEYITLCAMDIICDTAMGLDLNAQENPNVEYIRAVKQTSEYIFKRLTNPLSQFHWLYPFTSDARKQNKELKIMHDYATEVIVKRKVQLESELAKKTDVDSPKKRLSFLDILLSSTIDGRSLTNQEIREQVDTFMFAGHDTTTSAIGFAIYHLSQDHKLQEKVYAEIVSVLESDDANIQITHAHLQELKYLEMVIKETLRMYPSVPIIGRRLTDDTEIDGAIVPKGTNVNIFLYAVHHNPTVFPKPDHFDPDRFLDDYESRKNPYEYIPFSAGQRNCVGQKFAMLEMKIMLSKMLLNYVVLPAGEKKLTLDVRADLVLRPANGIGIKLRARK